MAEIMFCPYCGSDLFFADQLGNETVQCRKCRRAIPVAIRENAPKPTQPDAKNGKKSKATPVPPTPDETETQPRKRRKKKRTRGVSAPILAIDPVILKLVMGLFITVVVGAAIYFAVREVLRPSAPEVIPESQWRPVLISDRYHAKLPGPYRRQLQDVGSAGMQMNTCTLDNETFYAAGAMEGKLSAERAAQPETRLDEACNAVVQQVRNRDHKAKELSRESIRFGEHPGKQVVVKQSKTEGLTMARFYWIDGRLYALSAGGRGMILDHENTKRLFASFVEAETPAKASEPKKPVTASSPKKEESIPPKPKTPAAGKGRKD